MKKFFSLIFCVLTFSLLLNGESDFSGAHSPQKKLLIVCDMWEHTIGGVEELFHQVRNRFVKKGYRVELMGLADVDHFKVPIMASTKSPYPWGNNVKLAKKMKAFKPDYVLVIWHGFMSHQSASYFQEKKIPFIAFYPGLLPEAIKSVAGIPLFITNYVINNFLKKASKVVVASNAMKNHLLAQGVDHVLVWPHGIDIERFTLPTKAEKQLAIKKCMLEKKQHPFHLYVGRLDPMKNLDLFFNVSLPGTKIVVGPEDGYSIAALRKKYPDIIFTGGKQGDALLDYYRAADVFLFPSKIDAFGLVVVEALAMGVPTVCFDSFGPSEIIPKGCGVGYLAKNNKQFKHYALQAWKDVQSNPLLAQQCHNYAARFSWDVAMDELEKNLIQINYLR